VAAVATIATLETVELAVLAAAVKELEVTLLVLFQELRTLAAAVVAARARFM
jgi:hypothetical protein